MLFCRCCIRFIIIMRNSFMDKDLSDPLVLFTLSNSYPIHFTFFLFKAFIPSIVHSIFCLVFQVPFHYFMCPSCNYTFIFYKNDCWLKSLKYHKLNSFGKHFSKRKLFLKQNLKKIYKFFCPLLSQSSQLYMNFQPLHRILVTNKKPPDKNKPEKPLSRK